MNTQKILLVGVTVLFSFALAIVLPSSSLGLVVAPLNVYEPSISGERYAQNRAVASEEETNMSEQKNLVFGYSADAPPISFESGGTSTGGNTFCSQIQNKLNDERSPGGLLAGYNLIPVELDSSQRFRGLLEHKSLKSFLEDDPMELNGTKEQVIL